MAEALSVEAAIKLKLGGRGVRPSLNSPAIKKSFFWASLNQGQTFLQILLLISLFSSNLLKTNQFTHGINICIHAHTIHTYNFIKHCISLDKKKSHTIINLPYIQIIHFVSYFIGIVHFRHNNST